MNERTLQLVYRILEECLEEQYCAEELLSRIRDALALLNVRKTERSSSPLRRGANVVDVSPPLSSHQMQMAGLTDQER